MSYKKPIKHPAKGDENSQILDSLDDVGEENSDGNELSIYGLAAQLKNIITQYRMDRAERKHESKK
ncbi:hypothetical protein MTBPR1_260010 [Candidatus Terasakiella magnetica]|uniref:Uncharacterized protein n=1 Tax=Candidatus Terasakiella magnetica TaxID=1867952 RepID=A0A1C3RH68_9PROT|nr:hypothetical protein [Candidatus Terasakiella magnetica]SCA56615.1 hypothetical protein MTBPR1_260010 [Candidatus Terasakiella magnetica]